MCYTASLFPCCLSRDRCAFGRCRTIHEIRAHTVRLNFIVYLEFVVGFSCTYCIEPIIPSVSVCAFFALFFVCVLSSCDCPVCDSFGGRVIRSSITFTIVFVCLCVFVSRNSSFKLELLCLVGRSIPTRIVCNAVVQMFFSVYLCVCLCVFIQVRLLDMSFLSMHMCIRRV